MISYEDHLNEEQQCVVMADDGPILVIAGAGSGKTRALTYRVARLLDTGVAPQRIFLATFTNKAARTMLSRVAALVDVDAGALWGGTFHHIGNRILRKYSHLLGYDGSFTIMDQEDSAHLINACVTELGIVEKAQKFPKGTIVRDIISFAANTKETIDRVLYQRYPYFLDYAGDILSVAGRYELRKRELRLMYFDDLLVKVKELLVNFPEVREKYSQKFLHILVDEYQDTNIIQAEILDILASYHRNIMVVGDDSQSIYSFRGADYTNILRFPERYPEAQIFKLETNYRSTPEILHVANASITNNEHQFHKELRSVRRGGVRPIYVPVKNAAQQADFVAQRILDLHFEGVELGEVAVLYRAHYHSMELQMELTRRGIPFEVRSGIRFFEQAHIKDVTGFMRLIVNPHDEVAWKRLLQLYDRIGKVTAAKIWRFISKHHDPLSAVFTDAFLSCAPKPAQPGLMEFRQTMERIINRTEKQMIATVIQAILDGGYRRYLQEKYPDYTSRQDDLYQLAAFSEKFSSLDEFLSELALLTNMVEENDDDPLQKSEAKVVLGTIHQAKGLEWTTVFIIWCSEGMIPLARALKELGGEDEERRLFYVAITRAKDQLYFCHPLVDYTRNLGRALLQPSRFLNELVPTSSSSPAELPFDQWTIDEYYT